MESIVTSINLDLYSPTSYEVVKAQQGDKNLRQIHFNIFSNGDPYDVSDCTRVQVEGNYADGVPFFDEVSASGNTVIYTLNESVLYAAGIVKARLVFYNTDDSVLSSISFRISVQEDPADKNGIYERNSTIINDLIIELEQTKAQVNGMSDEVYTTSDTTQPTGQKDGDFWLKIL